MLVRYKRSRAALVSTLFVDFAMVLFEYSGSGYPVTAEGEDRAPFQQVASLVYAQSRHSSNGVGSNVFVFL